MAVKAVTFFQKPLYQGRSVTLIHDANDLTTWRKEIGGSVGSIRLYGTTIRVFTERDWKTEGEELKESVSDVARGQEGQEGQFASFYFVS